MSPNVQNPVQSQKHKYEVSRTHNLHYHNTRLHIITPPHMRVIVPEHKTRSVIPNIIIPRDVPWQRVITIQTGPVLQGIDRRWIPHYEQWAERVRETSPTQTATMLSSTKPVPVRSNLGATNSRPAPHREHNPSLIRLPMRRRYPYKNSRIPLNNRTPYPR